MSEAHETGETVRQLVAKLENNASSQPVTMVRSPGTMVKSPVAMVKSPVTMVKSPVTMVKSPVTMVMSPVTCDGSNLNRLQNIVKTQENSIQENVDFTRQGSREEVKATKCDENRNITVSCNVGDVVAVEANGSNANKVRMSPTRKVLKIHIPNRNSPLDVQPTVDDASHSSEHRAGFWENTSFQNNTSSKESCKSSEHMKSEPVRTDNISSTSPRTTAGPVKTDNVSSTSPKITAGPVIDGDLSENSSPESVKPPIAPKPKWLIGRSLPLPVDLPSNMTDSVIEEITDEPSALPSVSPLPTRRHCRLVRCRSLNAYDLDMKDYLSGTEVPTTPLTPGPYPRGHRSFLRFDDQVVRRSVSADAGFVFGGVSNAIFQLKVT